MGEVKWYRDQAELQRLLAKHAVVDDAKRHHLANAERYDDLADRILDQGVLKAMDLQNA